MKTFLEFMNETNYDNIIPKTVKLVQSKAWAKKNKDVFHDLFTNAGDDRGLAPEQSDEERRENFGKPRPVSKKGAENFRKKLKGMLSGSMKDGLGVNISNQVVDSLDDTKLLTVINNIYDAMGMKPRSEIK